jgi:hypothetical protein
VDKGLEVGGPVRGRLTRPFGFSPVDDLRNERSHKFKAMINQSIVTRTGNPSLPRPSHEDTTWHVFRGQHSELLSIPLFGDVAPTKSLSNNHGCSKDLIIPRSLQRQRLHHHNLSNRGVGPD